MVSPWWTYWLAYPTQRRIRVDVWQIGLTFRLMQLAIIGWVVYDIFSRHEWAYGEVPSGRVNAYGASTAQFVALLGTTPSYCSNPAHDYVYGGTWTYVQPSCRKVHVEEVVTKQVSAVTFTTSIIESVEHAWPCADADLAATKEEACAARGAPIEPDGLQCSCAKYETYYVTGVEAMGVEFDHGYSTTEAISGGLRGNSADAAVGDGAALDTYVHFSNGTTRTYHGGESIVLTLAELIGLNPQGYTLDTLNPAVQADARGTDAKPQFRMTGMKLTVDIAYSNLVPGGLGGETAPLDNPDVDASLEVEAEAGWAGAGPQIFFPASPVVDAGGTQTYEKLVRYRQGVVVVFRPRGRVYAFDWYHLMQVLLAGYLFLRVAVVVMDFVTFNLLPNGLSKVLYNKRAERVSKQHAFAQLGLKAAVAVADFKALDSDGKGYIDLKDLAAVFGAIPSISRQRALSIAQTVIRAADTDTELNGRIDFNEFVDFDSFVELVPTTGSLRTITEGDAAAAAAAFDAVESGVDLHLEAQKRRASSCATAAAGAGGEADAAAAAALQAAAADAAAARSSSQLTCYLCRQVFGVPAGARMLRCPHCQTVNAVTEQRTQSGLSFHHRRPVTQPRGVPPGPPPSAYQAVPESQPQLQLMLSCVQPMQPEPHAQAQPAVQHGQPWQAVPQQPWPAAVPGAQPHPSNVMQHC